MFGLQRQDECLANFAERDTLWLITQRRFEAFDWLAQRFEAEPKSLVMHRYDGTRAGRVRHLDRLLRRAMRSDPGIVRADRHDRYIDRSALVQFGKTIRKRGVAGEKDAPSVSLQKITVVTAVIVPPPPRAPVFHRDGKNINPTSGSLKRLRVAPTKLRNVAKSRPSQQVSRVRGGDHARILVKAMERSQIEMIKVRVRQKEDVDLRQLAEFESGCSQTFRADGQSRKSNPYARKKYGVSENFYSEEIDEHSRVTDPGDCRSRIAPLRRIRLGKSCGNRTPIFDRPFTPKAPQPTADARTA